MSFEPYLYEVIQNDSYQIPACFSPRTLQEQLIELREGNYRGSRTFQYYRKMREGSLIPPTPYLRYDGIGQGVGSVSAYYRSGPEPDACVGTVTRQNIAIPFKAAFRDSDAVFALCEVDTDALLRKAIASTLPTLDVLTTVAEFGETVSLLREVVERAQKLINKLRKKKFYAAAEAVGSAWLEWRYGWRLLYYDLRTLAEVIETPVRSLFIEGRAGETFQLAHKASFELPLLTSSTRVTAYGEMSAVDTLSVRANVNGKLKAHTVNPLPEGLNAFMSLPLSAWELIPLSFVLDMFFDIGTTISTWEAQLRADYTYSIGYKREHTAYGYITDVVSHNSSYTSPTASCTANFGAATKKRWLTGPPSKIPHATFSLTIPQIADIAALALGI